MNVQDAKALTITEGEVRTIHDSDGKELWGKLSYDTSYGGDTTQQTYSGKNQVDFTTISFSGSNGGSGTRDNNTFTVTNGSGGGAGGIQFYQTDLKLKTDTTYTFSAKVVSTTSSNGARVFASTAINSSGSYIYGSNAKSGEISVVTFTTPSSFGANAALRVYASSSENDMTSVFTDLQVEESSTATSYEPYVGGIASPNPDYPQNVNVVTGTQTITLTDGVVSHDYTVDLGSTELCKIGDYQDKIYKSGDDWYVYKEIGKLMLSGSVDEAWGAGNSTGSPNCLYCTSTILDNLSLSTGGVQVWAKCSHFTNAGKGLTSAVTDNVSEFAIGTSTSRLRVFVRKEIATNKATWDAWLASNTPVVYYALETPTDTKITDTTLIEQLEAISEFLTRYGYTSSVAGNLPMIINQTTLS